MDFSIEQMKDDMREKRAMSKPLKLSTNHKIVTNLQIRNIFELNFCC